MAEASEVPEAAELAPAVASSDNAPQRRILYARKGAKSTQSRVGRRPLAVPNWFDLPVLLPESHPVAARIQRNVAVRDGAMKNREDAGQKVMPKVSRLGSREEEEEKKVRKMGASVLKSAMRRRQRVRKLDGLGHADRKSRLREKLWKDLSRFGLWPMAGPGDCDDQQSLERTVDAIWTQWHDTAPSSVESDVNRESSNGAGYGVGDSVLSDGEVETNGVFLTGVPSVSSSTSTTPENGSDLSSRRRSSVFTDGGASSEAPEDDTMNEEEADSDLLSFEISATRKEAKVQTPGVRRRKRLTDLHHFVGMQLQKRLFKSWDTIEIAFSGSGDMTVSQIVKFLQLSDVQLGDKDAAKVKTILEDHVANLQVSQDTEIMEGEIPHYSKNRTKSRAVLSYEGFRQIFHPVDLQEASKWKREFDREKFRQKQEKDIYSKELTALEEKVRQRLANSAKQMIEILNQFQCTPNTIPWEMESTANCTGKKEKGKTSVFHLLGDVDRSLSTHSIELSDDTTTTSLTRIMETELGKKIKRKSRLYDLCLGLYLKYREHDRINMIGNVIAYRRFGRIFLKYLQTMVHHNKINRFATNLGAFRVVSSRFRQWMIGTVYKLASTPQNDDIEPAKKDDEAEEVGDKVTFNWRHDREWCLQGITNNPIRAELLRKDLLAIMENDSVRKDTIKGRELLLNKKQLGEDAFLRKETGVTLKMKAAQMQQVQQIMRRRAHRLHDAMDNVYDVLLQQQARQQLKSSFRSLRIVVMMKYTSLLCHRAQIRNWLRLCHRFMYWEKHMHAFYKLKLKYHAFQTLLKHAVWKWKFQSSGLSQKLQRSQQLVWNNKVFAGKHVPGYLLAMGAIYTVLESERSDNSTRRHSKWFGHCEKGAKFEIRSDYLTNREEIVGVFGHADSASINSLGVVMRHTTIKNPFEGLWVQRDHHAQQTILQQPPTRGAGEELPLCDRQFAYFLQVRACEVLLVMERTQLFALRAYRMEDILPPALGSMRIIMGLARWMLNALSHGLVHRTEHETEGKQILQSGQEKYAIGDKLLYEGMGTMQIVDSFRDSAGQLDAATLGVKKIVELREMMNQAQQQMTQGHQLMDEGQSQIMLSQRILPHLPTTKRMVSAIRKMYKVVQTKDEIDQMTPELRSILLLQKSGEPVADSLLAGPS
ncbi:hypothetical protein PRNP1_014598 [Phytophthora ramorum]